MADPVGMIIEMTNDIGKQRTYTTAKVQSVEPSRLSQNVHEPTPQSAQDALLRRATFIEILNPSACLCLSTSVNLFGRPFLTPDNASTIDPIVRLARKLPVTHRRLQRRLLVNFLQFPLGWPQRSAHFGAAPTRTKMHCRSKLFGDIQNSGFKRPRNVMNSNKLDLRQSRHRSRP
jgi:hypothetical protein